MTWLVVPKGTCPANPELLLIDTTAPPSSMLVATFHDAHQAAAIETLLVEQGHRYREVLNALDADEPF